MRARTRWAFLFVAASLLAGCATSRDTIVLLPKADGSTGAVAATRGGAEVLLDSAYASARGGGAKLRHGAMDEAAVRKKFGAALDAMPPPPKSFTVYFLSGGDEFTEESKRVLDAMLADMHERPAPEVTVIGHTDLVGSDADNDALSRQRAETVKAMLVARGVPAEQVTAVGRGSREPLVTTADGVAEERNRRVEVSVR